MEECCCCYANGRAEPVAVLLLWGRWARGSMRASEGRRNVQSVSARGLWGYSERATERTIVE